ncbi:MULTISPECIES: hypothetical protein [Yersinia]|uniref:hypothetical protein n=1 Tax=Yersinia TaxID=629 RepID=UPI000BFB9797|nr:MULTISPECIES: hypothetical protein [Yersinia]ATM86727.1 hypothetical protein CRN74_11920 [Yersinia frederiksenii]MCB5318088.1 hypothetical protein [Yersinia massiliensis]
MKIDIALLQSAVKKYIKTFEQHTENPLSAEALHAWDAADAELSTVINNDETNIIISLLERAEAAEASLSAANEKLSKPVVLSSSTVMSRACAVRAIKAAGFTVEGDITPIVIEPAPAEPLKRCAAARDGECHHAECPQLRDNEPKATGRHCPIDNWGDE